ncbi:MAG: ATP-dependent RecD-like DNA helicase [Lachnospiraceae bacterium]
MSYVAVYDRTIFYNPSNKYCIISVKSNDQSIPQKARSAYTHRDRMIRFVAVGYELPRTDKVSMLLDGEWQDGKHGYQLQVEKCEEIVPQTKEGVQGYLSSRLLKGIGPKIAEQIVERFGANALDVLENHPERLLEIRGITPGKLEEIQSSYVESRCLRDLMILLSPYQVTPVTATKIYEHFGAKSVEILQNNPYELCQVSGFGFKRVDAIALKNGLAFNSPLRIHGAVYAALDDQRSDKGHLFLTEDGLKKTAVKLLNEKQPIPQLGVKPSEIEPVMEDMILKGEIVRSEDNIYQVNCFVQEDETARRIAEILTFPGTPVDITAALNQVRQATGISPSQRQTEAVYMAYRNLLSVITGGPGTGKTTVLRVIIEIQKLLYPGSKILLAAPTGRASRRMAESTGCNDAKTLHSALGLLGDGVAISQDKRKEPLDADLIIVDESSMIDMWLAKQFFQRIRPGTRVVLVGDVDQLQSVGAGDVFRELIRCGLIPVTVLDEIFRQSKDSRIAYNAKKINQAETDLYYGEDFQFVKCQTQEEAADLICRLFCNQVEENGVEKVQILSPYRSEGLASVEKLNAVIREIVNPIQDDLPDLKIGGRFFRVGDKVMQTKNNAKASNGDIGFIRKIGRDEKNEMKVTIAFAEDRIAEYGAEDMSHIELSYATTIHKAMGSEYDTVIIPIIRSHAIMLNRNLVYTAITRAKQKVILVGQKGMLIMAIHKNETGKRNTLLGERIGKYLKVFALKQEKKAS